MWETILGTANGLTNSSSFRSAMSSSIHVHAAFATRPPIGLTSERLSNGRLSLFDAGLDRPRRKPGLGHVGLPEQFGSVSHDAESGSVKNPHPEPADTSQSSRFNGTTTS